MDQSQNITLTKLTNVSPFAFKIKGGRGNSPLSPHSNKDSVLFLLSQPGFLGLLLMLGCHQYLMHAFIQIDENLSSKFSEDIKISKFFFKSRLYSDLVIFTLSIQRCFAQKGEACTIKLNIKCSKSHLHTQLSSKSTMR